MLLLLPGNFLCQLAVNLLPLGLLGLLTLAEYLLQVVEQAKGAMSCPVGLILLDGLDQVPGILIAMFCRRLQVFHAQLPVTAAALAKEVKAAQAVFCVAVPGLGGFLQALHGFSWIPVFRLG